jgi:hypothetical protein
MAKVPRRRKISPLRGINWTDPCQEDLLRAATAYVDSGLSLIPIGDDGSKMPAFAFLPRFWDKRLGRYKRRWSVFRERLPTIEELHQWFAGEWVIEALGLAILGGSISGGLEIIDLDNKDVIGPWSDRVEELAPGLLRRLVRVKTPRPGMHAYYRCESFGGNQRLARVPDEDNIDPKTGNPKPKTIIEVKGEGGMCLAPPSPPSCHHRPVTTVLSPSQCALSLRGRQGPDAGRQNQHRRTPTTVPGGSGTERMGGTRENDSSASAVWSAA